MAHCCRNGFCRAEGALAGWSGMGGTVEDLYNRAISLSFEQWGLGSASSYLSNNTNTQANYTDADGGYGQNVAAVSSITINGTTPLPMRKNLNV